MAKPGPKIEWLSALDAGTRDELRTSVVSQESVRSLYSRFGMAKRGVPQRTFYHWVKGQRETNRAKHLERTPAPDTASMAETDMIAELRRRVLTSALRAFDAGDPKLYEIVSVLARVQEHDRVAVQQEAGKRAAEIHELKLKDLRTRFKADVEAKTQGDKTLSREDVYDLIDKAMRGE